MDVNWTQKNCCFNRRVYILTNVELKIVDTRQSPVRSPFRHVLLLDHEHGDELYELIGWREGGEMRGKLLTLSP